MQEFLLFIGLGLAGAIVAAIKKWGNTGSDTIDKPIKTEDGNYALLKPADKYMTGIVHDGISSTINPKQHDNSNPSGVGGSGSNSGI